MKKLFAILLTFAMLLCLAACGGEADPNAGKYLATTAKVMGMSMEMSEIYPGENWLELKSGGKGTIMLGGDSFPMKWALEGESITITIDGVDSVGTLKDGQIAIDFMNMGCELSFLKEGYEPPVPVISYNDAGYWEIIRVESEDPESVISEEDMEIVKAAGVLMYLELIEDGTGILFMDEELPITWQDGAVTFIEDDLTVSYTVENDEMVLDMFEAVFVLRKAEMPAVLYSEMEAAGFSEFMEVGVLYPFTTDANSANPVPTTGEVIVTSYEVFDSAEGYPAKEGYEWRIAEMEAMFFDDNARWYGIKLTSCTEDYYNTRLHDDSKTDADENGMSTHTVIYDRVEREVYSWHYSEWTGWQHNEDGRKENKLYVKNEYLVPKGYDGVVVGFVNSKNQWVDGSVYITDFDPADCILFRLK